MSVLRIQAVLAKAGRKLTAGEVSAASGLSPVAVGKHIAQMLQYGTASCVKREDGRRNLYYLTDEQVERFRERVEELRIVVDMAECRAAFCLPTDTLDIHDRLTFLRNVKERTVIGENPMLERVIEDYQRTLRLREAAAARKEQR